MLTYNDIRCWIGLDYAIFNCFIFSVFSLQVDDLESQSEVNVEVVSSRSSSDSYLISSTESIANKFINHHETKIGKMSKKFRHNSPSIASSNSCLDGFSTWLELDFLPATTNESIQAYHNDTMDQITGPISNEPSIHHSEPIDEFSKLSLSNAITLDLEIKLYKANDRIKQLEEKLEQKFKRIAQLEGVVKGYKQKTKGKKSGNGKQILVRSWL